MKPKLLLVLFLCILLVSISCGDDDDDNDTEDSDDDVADDDDSVAPGDDDDDAVSPQSIVDDHRDMAEAVASSMDQLQYFHDDTWHLHFGDGLMFGPSYDLASHALYPDDANYLRAIAALDTNAFQVEEASGSLIGLIGAADDVEGLAMAMLGLLESGQFIEVPRYFESAEKLAGIVDKLSKLMGDYLPQSLGEFAGATYGPTAITSMIALLQLGMAMADSDGDVEGYIARADEILQNIHDTAWSDELGVYRFAPGDDRIMLYPNATLMLAYGRAYELTQNETYRERIDAIYEGIQPLRADSGDHFFSPYSREEANAVDEDYSTLSSQNYLMIGLWLAYQATGDQQYLVDIDLILDWLEGHLFVDDVLKHHWVNGRVADETDAYDFCSGCNLQTLYILRIIEIGASE
jgi:hypothetical protein